MQKYVGLVHTADGTIHLYRHSKKMDSLCGFKFGLNEKITWGTESIVNCTKCQEVLEKEYRDALELEIAQQRTEQIEFLETIDPEETERENSVISPSITQEEVAASKETHTDINKDSADEEDIIIYI